MPARDSFSTKLTTRSELLTLASQWRAEGHRIVFTNGCFDLLHVGHIRYLRDAKALGDRLVVGLNSDCSVKEIKGPSRPLVPESERAEVLSALEMVDAVTLFDEPTPLALIDALHPEIHVKGGDYTVETLPETPVVQAYGGTVVILHYWKGRSTTALLAKLGAL
jgi:rfaE bifunctional protein nucleotidyltransferase chain/domain